jgi:hypothetical protein
VDAAVVVKRGAASSSADSVIFNITRPPAGIYKLRFFGAAVEGDATGDQAFVSTEVGPVLLLSGRGGQESVGARATAVASALNARRGERVAGAGGGLRVDVGDDDLHASTGEAVRHRRPDAAAGTGDHRDASGEIAHENVLVS